MKFEARPELLPRVGRGCFGLPARGCRRSAARDGSRGSAAALDRVGKGGGGTVNGPSGYSRQAPSAIDTPTLSAGPGQLIIDFAGPADNGDSAIIDYVIQYGTDPTFASTTTATTTNGHNVYTVTPGQLYYARIYSRNAVTNAAGAWSVPSGVGSVRVGIGGKRFDGTSEIPFTQAFRWDGSQEVAITQAFRWDGAAEVPITG